MTNLDSVLESRDITLLTKVHVGKAVVFPVIMYKCESGTCGCTIDLKVTAMSSQQDLLSGGHVTLIPCSSGYRWLIAFWEGTFGEHVSFG